MKASRPSDDPHDLVRRHQSSARALLYSLAGGADVEVSGDGPWVTGESGRVYLDFGSFAVFLLGHRPARVVDRVHRQLDLLPNSTRAFPSRINAEACRAFAGLAPEGLEKVMLLNSGAEAVEAAIKLTRAATGRSTVVHLHGSFHGKTYGALSLTDVPEFRTSVGSLLPDVCRLDPGDTSGVQDFVSAIRPAAVFVEAIQGEGGVRPLSSEFLRAVRQATEDVGSLLVCDEIQVGLGRAGTLWAFNSAGITPDVLLSGKALGGGVMPVSALAATASAFRPFDRDPLLHTSTFGGNPLASAAVSATVELIIELDVPALACRYESRLRSVLEDVASAWPALFTAVTGRGLIQGLHCARADIAGTMLRECLMRGLVVTPCLSKPSVLRFTPPAICGETEYDLAADVLRRAAEATENEEREEPCQL
jgi:putrescine aminotransferase